MKHIITEHEISGLTELQEVDYVKLHYKIQVLPNTKEGFRILMSGTATVYLTVYKTVEGSCESDLVNVWDRDEVISLEVESFHFNTAPDTECKDFDPCLLIEDFNTDNPVVYVNFESR